MQIGDKVLLVYDARPLRKADGTPMMGQYPATVTKITKTGNLRIQSDEKQGEEPLYDELFPPRPLSFAKGWNTLRWRHLPVQEGGGTV